MKRIIVYHDQHHDGITALWAALQCWPDASPYAGKYDVPPDLERLRDADVVIVGFSWKRGPMFEVASVARSLFVLDHHKTAEVELAGLGDGMGSLLRAVFDQRRSGAGLAWDELVGGPRPRLIDYVEDRDLWRFALPFSREVHAACASYPLSLEARCVLMMRAIEDLRDEGSSILRYHNKLIEDAAQYAGRETIGGHEVPAIACPVREIASDLGHRLAQRAPFAAVFTDRPNGSRYYQLRSTNEGLDVGEIAKALGGGGHSHAAGFVQRFRWKAVRTG